MLTIPNAKLRYILDRHELWLEDKDGGERADLTGANLSHRSLVGVNLSYADLSGADISFTDLTRANLIGAALENAYLENSCLSWANLAKASLEGAYMRNTVLNYANLTKANLRGAKLRGAKLIAADLHGANLSGACLSDVSVNEATRGYFMICPAEGSFIGYKKAEGKIVVLEIPADAKRSSATTPKCRCSKAKVLRIEELDGSISEKKSVGSDFDYLFVYSVGKTVEVPDFDEDRWDECSRGIHFFISKELARAYNG